MTNSKHEDEYRNQSTQTDEALKESEEKYRALYDNAPLSYQSLTEEGCFKDINPAWLRTLGYNREEVIGQWFGDFLHPDYKANFEKKFPEFKRRGYVHDVHFKIRHKDGHYLDILFEGCIGFHPDGSFKQTYCVFQDITERKRAEETLQYRLEFEKIIARISADFINMSVEEIDEGINEVLKKIGEFTGAVRSSVFLITDNLTTLTNTHEWCAVPDDLQIDLLQGIPFESFGYYREILVRHEYVVVNSLEDMPPDKAHNEREWVKKHGFRPLLFAPMIYQGTLYGTLGFYGSVDEKRIWPETFVSLLKFVGDIIINALERKKAEEALRESEEKHRTLFNTMAQGVVYQAVSGEILSANPAAEKILGLTLDQMQGRTSIDPRWRSMHEDGREFSGDTHPAMVALKTGKEVNNVDMGVFNPRDDQTHWINIHAVPQFKTGKKTPYQVFATFDDITERKKAEKDLKQSKETAERYLNVAAEIIITLDKKGNITLLNESGHRLFGYKIGELIGRNWFDTCLPEQMKKEVREVFRSLMRGDVENVETKENLILTKNGEERMILWHNTLIKDDEGRITGTLSSGEDISEHKRSEAALRISAQRWQTTFDSITDIVTVISKEHEFIEINETGCDTLGMKKEEIIGKKCYEVVHGRDKPLEGCPCEKAMTTKKVELSEIKENGRDYSINAWPILDENNDIIAFTHVVKDITERKLAEESLQHSETRFRTLAENSMVGVFIIQDMKFNYINPAVMAIFDDCEENFLNKGPIDYTHPDYHDASKEYIMNLYTENPYMKPFKFKGIKADGNEIDCEIQARIIEYFGKPAIIGVISDITAQKKAEKFLHNSLRELNIRNQIANIFLTVSDADMYNDILKIFLDAMDSKLGVFGYLDKDGALVVPSMTTHIWDECQVPEKKYIFTCVNWGDSTWPQAIQEKKTIYSNEPSTNIPQGHIAIKRHISLPIIHRDEVIGLLQVANKETDYEEVDIQLFETIGKAIAPVLNARLQIERKNKEKRAMEPIFRTHLRDFLIIHSHFNDYS